jgi:hypothetical protein
MDIEEVCYYRAELLSGNCRATQRKGQIQEYAKNIGQDRYPLMQFDINHFQTRKN